jgi:hypothetical protein
VSAANALGAHDQRAGAVHGRANDAVASVLFDRDRLAGHQRFVNGARSIENRSIHWHLFARSDTQPVADTHLVERYVLIAAVVTQPARGFRRQAEKRSNGSACLTPRREVP